MKNFLSNLRYKLSGFMQGRNGSDQLNRFIIILSLLFLIVSLFTVRYLYYAGLVLIVLAFLRMFSKNIYRRQKENNKYLEIKNKIFSKFSSTKSMWKDRKTHRYFKCPSCKANVRIKTPPKGATISLKCPKCATAIIKKF